MAEIYYSSFSNSEAERKMHAVMGVDTIIRMHDVRLLQECDRALFSIFHQTYALVRPIIVTQGFNHEALQRVKALATRYDWEAKGAGVLILNVPNPAGHDIRSRLLNAGLGAATGRFLSVLDSDDYLYGSAIQWLVCSLQNGKFAIAFGDIALKNIAITADAPFTFSRETGVYKGEGLKDLMDENFCPIHSFVIDRSVIDSADLFFTESIARLEDYDFLIRICSKYQANFSSRSKVVGIYNWKADGSNSTLVGSETEDQIKEKQGPWDLARKHLEQTKRDALARLGWS